MKIDDKLILEETNDPNNISPTPSALCRTRQLKDRMAETGWDWRNAEELFAKIEEELEEVRAEVTADEICTEKLAAEIGDMIFMLADLARWFGIDAEYAVQETNTRLEKRFNQMNASLIACGEDIETATLERRRALWNAAKKMEKASR